MNACSCASYTRLVRTVRVIIAIVVLVAAVFVAYDMWSTGSTGASSPQDATYLIDGTAVALKSGGAEKPAAADSAATTVTRYFGNEVAADLDGDGRQDLAFILTQQGAGAGTYFYAVAALNTKDGYVGSDGYLLGDRIAPQPTMLSPNPNQKGVVVFNYADRAPGEPMSAQPSVGKSVYLKLDPATMQWGIVQPDFEGESAR